jgi:hypothetical protein
MRALALLLLASVSAFAQITLPTTFTVDGTEFTEVVYRSHDAAKLRFAHAGGLAAVEIAKLSPEMQAALGYDPAAAADAVAAEQAQLAANAAAIQRRKEEARRQHNEHDAARVASVESGKIEAKRKQLAAAKAELKGLLLKHPELAPTVTGYRMVNGLSMEVTRVPEVNVNTGTPEEKARKSRIVALREYIAALQSELR